MIHLKHHEHGYHIAYTEVEARSCEKNGWKRCDIAKEFEEARKAKSTHEPEEPTKRKYVRRGD